MTRSPERPAAPSDAAPVDAAPSDAAPSDAAPVDAAHAEPEAALEAFLERMAERGLTPYPAQEEALLELATGSNVVLATPTGSGKSLVAAGAIELTLAAGGRSYYTAPIKALVSEKFFQMIDEFGAERVGMVTGDTSINPDAPVVCCTAEILANLSLREGERADVDLVVMDEFHFYGDPDRGWAWQAPLLTLPQAQFLLMSATLGDVTEIMRDLSERTGRETALVAGSERPVPLEYHYVSTPIHETVERLLTDGLAPIYLVHFGQAQAVERAQALSSLKLVTREQRDAIAEEIGEFRFLAGFGKTLSRLVRGGVGVHHAGMLPRYRRLVEHLAGKGLLPVICGTDTLGVGINVPIHTVLLTQLTKFDGRRMRLLSTREFHQLAGRAGRAGFDSTGDVVAEAPEHEIENARALAKAQEDAGKKRKKVQLKKPPAGFVTWNEARFERLIAAQPETLRSSLRVDHSTVLNFLAREDGDPVRALAAYIFGSHEPRPRKFQLARRALEIGRTLRQAGIIEVRDGRPRLTVELQDGFALNQPLSPFAVAAIELHDPASADYPLDVISTVEATLENPRAILLAQEHAAKREAVAAMKAEGIQYDERMELLEDVTYPKPLEELLDAAYEQYAAELPWARDFELRPKSVVRDMYERAMGFREYVAFYQLARSEGVVLRYLSDAYRAIRQTVPEQARTEELSAIIDWLGELVRQVDSSLLEEWTELSAGDVAGAEANAELLPPPPPRLTQQTRAFTVLVRNELFRRVQLADLGRWDELGELDGAAGFDSDAWREAIDGGYFAQYASLGVGADARNPALFTAVPEGGVWHVRQVFDDPEGDHDWGITADVDLAESDEAGEPVVRVTSVGPFPAGWPAAGA